MSKEKLALDIDETIVHLLGPFLEYYNEKYGTNFSEGEFSTYDWGREMGIRRDYAYKRMESFAEQEMKVIPSAYPRTYINFVEGAEEALDLLSRFYDLYRVSHRSTSLIERTGVLSSALYVENNQDGTYFPDVPFEDLEEDEGRLILPMDRIYLTEGRTKAEVCNDLSIEKIVDDDPGVARKCAREGIQAVLLEKPWNKDLEERSLIEKARGWGEACDILLGGEFDYEF